MNSKNLKLAEKIFLKEYPKGFKHPEMVEIGKRHKMEQMTTFSRETYQKNNFNDPHFITEETIKLVTRSSMISLFEKPKFRDYVKSLNLREKKLFTQNLFELLHGKEKQGFESLVEQLKKRKLARWPVATVVQAYYRPTRDIFVKPTTTKLIIEKLELDIVYKPTPTWDFYRKYRKIIKELKSVTASSLAPSNPAFCGFLMMSLPQLPE